MRTKLQKKTAPPAPRIREEQIHAQLSHAAGSSAFSRRDPVSYVTESFHQSFDRLGMQRAGELLSGSQDTSRQITERGQTESAENRRADGMPAYLPGTEVPLRKFSETAFKRGRLAASVLRGTGKMMLVSCLKRTIGQSDLESSREQNLLRSGAQQRNVPGHTPDSVLFTRGVTQSAVGLVVDTLRDARRVVQSMEDLAAGTGEVRGGVEGSTLRAMYPFLDDSRERALLEEYRRQLAASEDAEEAALLQNALVHTRALIGKKAQMKEEFINKLRLVSDRAAETLAELEAPGAVEEITAAVLVPETEELPPPLPPEDDGEGDGAGGTADRLPAADRAGTDTEEPGAQTGDGV